MKLFIFDLCCLILVVQTPLAMLFSRTLQRYVRLMAKAVRLSSLTVLHSKQKIERFGNIFALSNSLGTRTVCVKILGKNQKGFYRGLRKLNTMGYEKLALLTNISLCFKNGKRYGHSYNGRLSRYGFTPRSSILYWQWRTSLHTQ